MDNSLLEEKLWRKAKKVVRELRGIREPKVEDIFKRCCYINPEGLVMTNYLRSRPLAAFNPGSILRNKRLLIFPRIVFDYANYVSSIGGRNGRC
jgi:predicted GH43/DUF377 family glycosyl hydrolase